MNVASVPGQAGRPVRRPAWGRLAGLVVVGATLGACAFTFGEPPEGERPSSTPGPTRERLQDSRRLYLQEYELTERQRQLFETGGSER